MTRPRTALAFAFVVSSGCGSQPVDVEESSAELGENAGSLDATFGDKGRVLSQRFDLCCGDLDLGIWLGDGTMLVGGSKVSYGDVGTSTNRNPPKGAHLIKLLRNGDVDPAFGIDGHLSIVMFEGKDGAEPSRYASTLVTLHPRGPNGFWVQASFPFRTLAYDNLGRLDRSVPNFEDAEVLIDNKGRAYAQRCKRIPGPVPTSLDPISCTVERYGFDGQKDRSFEAVTKDGSVKMFLAGDGILDGSHAWIPETGGKIVPLADLPADHPDPYRRPQQHRSPCSFAIASDGSIFTAGWTNHQRAELQKFTRDWAIDPTFGDRGSVAFPWKSRAEPNRWCLTIDAENRILVSSRADGSFRDKIGVARVLPDGRFDRNFDEDGRMNIGDIGVWLTPLAIQVGKGGRIEVFGFDNYGPTENRARAFGVMP